MRRWLPLSAVLLAGVLFGLGGFTFVYAKGYSQDRTYELRNIAIDAVLQLTGAIADAAAADSTDANLARARDYQRRAQFLTDFIEAENSMGFHAPQEAARVLGNAINHARIGLAELDGRNLPDPEASGRPAPEQTVSPGTAPGNPH